MRSRQPSSYANQSKLSSSNSIPSPSPLDESKEPEPYVDECKYKASAPFLNRLKPRKYSAQMEKIFEVFRQVKVSIPLLHVIE